MNDPVRDYLKRQGYAGYIVEGGIEYLLTSWESTVASIVDGDYVDYNSYVKCMDRRRILEETLALIPMYQQAGFHKQIYEADDRIKQHLVFVDAPLCGPAIAAEKGYSPEHEWWYFHRPRRIDQTWPEAAGRWF